MAAAAEPSIPETPAADALRGQAAAKDDFDCGEFAFESGPAPTALPAEMPAASGVNGEFDFAEFEMTSGASFTAAVEPDAAGDFDFQDFAMQDAAPPAPIPEPDMTGGFDFEDVDLSLGSASAESVGPAVIGEFDFDDSATPAASSGTAPAVQKDFGELVFDEETAVAGAAPGEIDVPGDFAFGEHDFGGDEKTAVPGASADVTLPDDDPFAFAQELSQPTPKAPGTPAGAAPSFNSDKFSLEKEGAPPAPAFAIGDSAQPEAAVKSAAPADVNFSAVPSFEFSFEPEPAAPVTASPTRETSKTAEEPASFKLDDFNIDEATPSGKVDAKSGLSGESWGAGTYGGSLDGQAGYGSGLDMPIFADDPPPLSISSRRRGGSFFPLVVIAISVLLVLGMAAGGFFFFKGRARGPGTDWSWPRGEVAGA